MHTKQNPHIMTKISVHVHASLWHFENILSPLCGMIIYMAKSAGLYGLSNINTGRLQSNTLGEEN